VSLPLAHRLKRRQDFNAVYQRGRRFATSHLFLRALAQSSAVGERPSRFGFVISQKVDKRAVVRNRLRRQLQAKVRALLPRLKSGWSVIVSLRPGITQCDSADFLQELEELLTKAEVLDGHTGRSVL
jgi:ribonuclease P protein component